VSFLFNDVISDISAFDLYLWGHITTLVFSTPFENEGNLHKPILMSAKPFATAPGILKGCDFS
jgi:hypothetical protein